MTNATLIDGTGRVLQDHTVVITADHITSVGPANKTTVPQGARTISGAGRFLIPGLWDMHVHLGVAGASALPVLLANGVTGVRDMGGPLADLDRWRTQISSGVQDGPRIFRAGPILNAKAFNEMQVPVENEDQARGAVRALNKSGVDFIKVHAAISRPAYFGVADECRRLGMQFAGHIPRAVGPAEAGSAGQTSIEHLYTLFDGTLAAGTAPDQLSERIVRFRSGEANHLFTALAKSNTAFTPTLSMEYASLRLTDHGDAAFAKYTSPSAQNITREMQVKYKDVFTPAFIERQRKQLGESLPLVSMMHRNGMRLLSGTDMGSSLLAPGFSLHTELALLADAGLPAMEVIQAGTRNCAQWLGLDDVGTIEPGKIADMVLLDANPLADIRNTQKVRTVISRGRVFDRPALDAMLRTAEHAVRGKEH